MRRCLNFGRFWLGIILSMIIPLASVFAQEAPEEGQEAKPAEAPAEGKQEGEKQQGENQQGENQQGETQEGENQEAEEEKPFDWRPEREELIRGIRQEVKRRMEENVTLDNLVEGLIKKYEKTYEDGARVRILNSRTRFIEEQESRWREEYAGTELEGLPYPDTKKFINFKVKPMDWGKVKGKLEAEKEKLDARLGAVEEDLRNAKPEASKEELAEIENKISTMRSDAQKRATTAALAAGETKARKLSDELEEQLRKAYYDTYGIEVNAKGEPVLTKYADMFRKKGKEKYPFYEWRRENKPQKFKIKRRGGKGANANIEGYLYVWTPKRINIDRHWINKNDLDDETASLFYPDVNEKMVNRYVEAELRSLLAKRDVFVMDWVQILLPDRLYSAGLVPKKFLSPRKGKITPVYHCNAKGEFTPIKKENGRCVEYKVNVKDFDYLARQSANPTSWIPAEEFLREMLNGDMEIALALIGPKTEKDWFEHAKDEHECNDDYQSFKVETEISKEEFDKKCEEWKKDKNLQVGSNLIVNINPDYYARVGVSNIMVQQGNEKVKLITYEWLPRQEVEKRKEAAKQNTEGGE